MVFSGFELGLNVLTVGWNDVLLKLSADNPLKIAFEAFINNFLGMYHNLYKLRPNRNT